MDVPSRDQISYGPRYPRVTVLCHSALQVPTSLKGVSSKDQRPPPKSTGTLIVQTKRKSPHQDLERWISKVPVRYCLKVTSPSPPFLTKGYKYSRNVHLDSPFQGKTLEAAIEDTDTPILLKTSNFSSRKDG